MTEAEAMRWYASRYKAWLALHEQSKEVERLKQEAFDSLQVAEKQLVNLGPSRPYFAVGGTIYKIDRGCVSTCSHIVLTEQPEPEPAVVTQESARAIGITTQAGR